MPLANEGSKRFDAFPISAKRDLMEKDPVGLGSQNQESSPCERTIDFRARLRSAHSVASSSFKFLLSWIFQKLLIEFHTS